MAQKAQVIDITRSYLPGDPNSFPETLISTQREDVQEKMPPVLIYEGYNFLPTPYGYKSYFGTNGKLNVPAVPSRVQFILCYQSTEYVNNLIALCEDGIWILDPTASSNTWKHVVVHSFAPTMFEEWTWCMIENTLYFYKQGKAAYYKTSEANDVPNGLSISVVSVVPTFLNMAGQMGIFKAGTRLGFWDSANSISWSSNLDLSNFSPSLETLAGNTIFGAVIGRITHVRDHGEGFIIYSTKSIVGVSFEASNNMLWDAHTISDICGVAVGREVASGATNKEQFAYTTAGLHRIGSYNGLTKVHEFQQVAVELSDLLKESRYPVYLDCVEGRFLYLHAIDNTYINGIISFEAVSIAGMTLNGIPNLESQKIAPQLLVKMLQKIEKDTADSAYGNTLVQYVANSTPFDVIEWEVSFRSPAELGLWEKNQNPSSGGKFNYLSAPGVLDLTGLGYAFGNRTPTGQVFIPAVGSTLMPLDTDPFNPAPLSLESSLYKRKTIVDTQLKEFSSLVARFQAEAFAAEDNAEMEIPLGSVSQELCNFQPSYLPLTNRTKNGLLEEVYNIASIWKDFEKRQYLLLQKLMELSVQAKQHSYTMWSIQTFDPSPPVGISWPIYKPQGAVGIQPMDKGFFLYKQYRDYLDLMVAATRTVQNLTHNMVGEGVYSASCPYVLQSYASLTIPGATPKLDPQFVQTTSNIATISYPQIFKDSIVEFQGKMVVAVSESANSMLYTRLYSSIDGATWTLMSTILHNNQPDFGSVYYGWEAAEVCNRLIVLNGYLHCLMPKQAGDVTCGFRSLDGISWTRIVAPSAGPLLYFATKLSFCNETDTSAFVHVDSGDVTVKGKIYRTSDFITYIYVGAGAGAVTANGFYKVGAGWMIASTLTRYLFSASGVGYTAGPIIDNTKPTSDIPCVVKGGFLYAFAGTRVYKVGASTVEEVGTKAASPIQGAFIPMLNFAGNNYALIPSSGGTEPYYDTACWKAADVYAAAEDTADEVLTLEKQPYDAQFLQKLILSSKTSGIFFPTSGRTMKFLDFEYQGFTPPWNVDGAIRLQMYDVAVGAHIYYAVKIAAKTMITMDSIFSNSPTMSRLVKWKVQKETAGVAAAYPYLISPVGVGETIGIYQSFEQAFVGLATNGVHLRLTLRFYQTPEGKLYRQSEDPSVYYVVSKSDFMEVHTQVYHADTYSWHDEVVCLMRQTEGMIYQYNVTETLTLSVQDNGNVAMAGGLLVPSLQPLNGANVIGAVFTPKAKVSCTIANGALVRGASTALNTYTTLKPLIDGYLRDNYHATQVYVLPPVWDEGERWWYMKDATHTYETKSIVNHKLGDINSIPAKLWSTDLYLDNVDPYDIPTTDLVVVTPSIGTLPGSSFNLQVGVPAPSYPSFQGAYVFDLGLKKWGKMKGEYKVLISFSPLNSNAGGAITYSNFGMDSGVLTATGEIRLFDTAPVDSWMRIGKLGYYRLGMTDLLEVKAMFRSAASGKLTVDTSMDGRNIDPTLRYSIPYTNVANITAYPDVSGRWHAIKIEGKYDLQYLEVRGTIAGRR